MKEVYQVIDSELYTRGLFEHYDDAVAAAEKMFEQDRRGAYQVNRIPLNKVGNYGEAFDVMWCIGLDPMFTAPPNSFKR